MALASAVRVSDTADEIDLEPVSHSALRSLLDTQRTVRDVPVGVDVTKLSRVTVLGEGEDAAADVRGALRAWVAQAVTWHDPTMLGVAVASPELESAAWSWCKWLPHTDIAGQADGVGPARYLAGSGEELAALLGPVLAARPPFTGEAGESGRHLLVIIDDPDFDVAASVLGAARAGVTIVQRGAVAPGREQYSDPERPILRVTAGGVAIDRWQSGAGRVMSMPPIRWVLRRRRIWRGACPAGIRTRRMPGCGRPAPAGPPSPHCWASMMLPAWMCRHCGRRAAVSRSCGSRSG